jgi:hypothetical protein
MKIVEVNSAALANAFIEINAQMHQGNPNYIRPLNKEVAEVFDQNKNKLFQQGNAKRWLLENKEGKLIGRIAAFYYSSYKNKGTEFPVGCVGFFDCIDDFDAAQLLFDTAKNWLAENGMQAMDGPINFGDRDKWWGLMVKGFEQAPMYGMSYNPSYYESLFKQYGFENFYNQYYYQKDLLEPLPPRFEERYHKFKAKPDYSALHLEKNKLEKFAKDFVHIYNSAWAQHGEAKAISYDQVIQLFNTLKAVMDEKVIWFAYYKEEPIAMFINIPDLNQYFKYFNGQLGLLQKLHLWWMKWNKSNTKLTGLAFGVVPKYQALGVDSFLIYACNLGLKETEIYQEYEMGWAADWNPKMVNIYKSLGALPSRQMVTYRYIFDTNANPFERHPMMDYSVKS